MKRKTQQAVDFIENLHQHLINSSLFRQNTAGEKERDIQREIRHIIVEFLKGRGYTNCDDKVKGSFYAEVQEGSDSRIKTPVFGSKNYPDFYITDPYWLAIEYKKELSGSFVKSLIGQSMVHTFSGDFDYVYALFQDENKNKKIRDSVSGEVESDIIATIERDYNIFLRII